MTDSPRQPPRSIMRMINESSVPSTPTRQTQNDEGISHQLSLNPLSLQTALRLTSPPPTTPRRSVRFSPAPVAIFETYSPRDYDRRSADETHEHPPRSGHLNSLDLMQFREGLQSMEYQASSTATRARGQRGAMLLPEDDPFADSDSDSNENWSNSTPRRGTLGGPSRPIPRLQFNMPGSDSEDDDGVEEEERNDLVVLLPSSSPSALEVEAEAEAHCPITFLAASFSAMPMPVRENIWPTPTASEARPTHFEDHMGDYLVLLHSVKCGFRIDDSMLADVIMPAATPRSIRTGPSSPQSGSSQYNQSTPSRRTITRPTPTSPTPTRSSPPSASVLHVPTTPTRSKTLRSPIRSPARPALSPKENYPHAMGYSAARSLTRDFRMRLIQNQRRMAEVNLGVINENEDD
ncbi:hypothetical protein BXZ70DRAFT_911596 [Cristinia sonorae]|uniref:Neurabin-1/2 PDZ domain-containing protein n=1 Tax=Cristinia sonorae TaxID=1940300 RepID=A0A8K0XK09_9AGAR|nr:hypothetical protein BXZ70DRAFT_911596 [Cristinia sonorae]